MVWQSPLSHSVRQKGDIDDTQQSSPLMTPIKSEQIFDMYFDTIFYWYWRGVHNIKYSSAFQEIRARAVLSQKLSRDPWEVPIRSHTSEPRLTRVHFSFYKRLWCMVSPCYICLRFLFHARTHITSVICLLMISLLFHSDVFFFFFSKSEAFASPSSHQVCSSITWHDATFATIRRCRVLISHILFHE